MATVGLIIDVFLIIFVVIFALIGLKKGFLKSIISLFSWVVCLVVAIFTAKYVAGWLNGIFNLSNMLGGKISGELIKSNEFFAKAISSFENKEQIIASIPANTNGLLKQLINVVLSNEKLDMSSNISVGTVVGSSLGHICVVIIAGVLVFVVLKIIVAILNKVFDNISKTKIFGTLNKILGLILGTVKALGIVFVLNGILVLLSLVPVVNKTINPLIKQNTHVEKFVYEQTDKFVEQNIINGNLIQTWVTDLWNAR